jgi:hypothetical protein
MKYRIKKAKVLEALATEPLKAGHFMKLKYEEVDDGKCSVCAVGAIFRKTKPKFFTSHDINTSMGGLYIGALIDQAWIDGNFLDILSAEFEYASQECGEETARLHAIMVAEAICPEVLEFYTRA